MYDVQRVALDPLAAIQQPAQRPDLAADRDAERVLHRVHRAHLVGDRADAADARGDVRRLGRSRGRAGTPRRSRGGSKIFSFARLRRVPSLDPQVERALAFDAGEQCRP